MEDYFGIQAFDKHGILEPAVPAIYSELKFYRRFRMSPYTFEKLYNGIVDPVTGSLEFQKGRDATGAMGASALQKMVSCVRQLACGNSADVAEEYTGVQEETGRLMLYAFCTWLDVVHGPTFLGAWTEEAIKEEMDKNAERGFTGMLGSIDCTHWGWKNRPMPWAGQFQDRSGMRSVIAEAVAGHDMYFWHVCLGSPGSLNDIQVLARSTITAAHNHCLHT